MNLRQSQAPNHNVLKLRRVSIAATECKPLVIVYVYHRRASQFHYAINHHHVEIVNPTVKQLRLAYRAQLALNEKAKAERAMIAANIEKARQAESANERAV